MPTLQEAMARFEKDTATIVTFDEETDINVPEGVIHVAPSWKWLLEQRQVVCAIKLYPKSKDNLDSQMLIQKCNHLFTRFFVFEFEYPLARIVIEDVQEPTSLRSWRQRSAKNCASDSGNKLSGC